MTRSKKPFTRKGSGAVEDIPNMVPRGGDVLVSNPTATVEHTVSIVPAPPDLICPNHDAAIGKAHELARDRHVDVWLTEDHTHFLKIASYRMEDDPTST